MMDPLKDKQTEALSIEDANVIRINAKQLWKSFLDLRRDGYRFRMPGKLKYHACWIYY